MKRLRGAMYAVGLAAVTSGVSGVAATAAHASESGPLVIYNFQSDQCLQPVGGSVVAGAAIVQEPCDGSPFQTWIEVPVSGSVVHYRNSNSGLCLDARGGAVNGTPVQQWTCNSISNENWQPGPDELDTIPPLISRVSGTSSHCLDIPWSQTTPGLAMQIYGCNGTEAQDWWIAPQ